MDDATLAANLQAELDAEAAQALVDEEDEQKPVSNNKKKSSFFSKNKREGESLIDRGEFTVTAPFELAPVSVPDDFSTKCQKCNVTEFSFTKRRHHCRCCGMLLCNDCSLKKTLVAFPGQSEELNSKEQRVCDWCFDHISDGHAHCFSRYVIVATLDKSDLHKEMAIKGMGEVIEGFPNAKSSEDVEQMKRDLEVYRFVGGVGVFVFF